MQNVLHLVSAVAFGSMCIQGPVLTDKNPGTVSVTSFGAVGDNTTDDTLAIQKAADVAAAFRPGIELLFPASAGYVVSSTINILPGIDVDMRGRLVCKSGDYTCLQIGTADVDNGNVRLRGLAAIRSPASDWTSEDNIGIQLINTNTAFVEVHQASNFTIGVQAIGSGSGFAYNTVRLNYFSNNKIGLDLTQENNGWQNENIFTGGRFTNIGSLNSGLDRTGLRITSKDGTYLDANNNVFLKPSFEYSGLTGGATGLPIHVVYGVQNTFLHYRVEGEMPVIARLENGSTENYFEGGFDQYKLLDDRSIYAGNVLVQARTKYQRTHNRTLRYFSLADRYNKPRLGIVQFVGMSVMVDPATSPSLFGGGSSFVPQTDGSIELNTSSAVGFAVDTSVVKTFVVSRGIPEGRVGGVFVVKTYDGAGAELTNTGPNHPYLRGPINDAGFFGTSVFGGVYTEGSDSNLAWLIRLHEDVKSIWVGVAGGTNPAYITSIAIHTILGGPDPAVTSGLKPTWDRPVSPGAPNTGTWSTGQFLWNSTPAPDGSGNVVLGWMRMSDGSGHVLGTDWILSYAGQALP